MQQHVCIYTIPRPALPVKSPTEKNRSRPRRFRGSRPENCAEWLGFSTSFQKAGPEPADGQNAPWEKGLQGGEAKEGNLLIWRLFCVLRTMNGRHNEKRRAKFYKKFFQKPLDSPEGLCYDTDTERNPPTESSDSRKDGCPMMTKFVSQSKTP